jgi:hypothetical protein
VLSYRFADRPSVHPDDDPATPGRRAELARLMLVEAIRRYEAACLEWTAVSESYPNLSRAKSPSTDEGAAEQRRWRDLLRLADEGFNHAELTLAERIDGLFDMLSTAGGRADDDPDGYFVPRAVRSGGNLYVLAYGADEYEPKTNIIAVYRESKVIDLDEGAS